MGTRADILAAARRIMRDEGYARATTKQIARAAGYSEAALYKHFRDKTEIFLGVLGEQLPALAALLAELGQRPGAATVRANLTRVARTALDFYTESFPIAASLFSSRDLLVAHRDALRDRESGPRTPLTALTGYLRAEQRSGRLPDTVDAEAAASLLLGSCFQQAFLIHFEGTEAGGDQLDALAERLVGTLLAGLAEPAR